MKFLIMSSGSPCENASVQNAMHKVQLLQNYGSVQDEAGSNLAEVHNLEMSISIIWPWPINLRYYLKLEHRSH